MFSVLHGEAWALGSVGDTRVLVPRHISRDILGKQMMLFFPVCPVPVQKASVSKVCADNLTFLKWKNLCWRKRRGEMKVKM